MFALDACLAFALTGSEPVCTMGFNPATANTLISVNALNQGQGIAAGGGAKTAWFKDTEGNIMALIQEGG